MKMYSVLLVAVFAGSVAAQGVDAGSAVVNLDGVEGSNIVSTSVNLNENVVPMHTNSEVTVTISKSLATNVGNISKPVSVIHTHGVTISKSLTSSFRAR
jgi:hypothetical protein